MSQDRDPFVQAAKRTPVDLREWAVGLMEKDNRKSHLAPQLSPSTKDLLRSADSPTNFAPASDASSIPTPTSGDIPIAGAGIASPYGSSAKRSPTWNEQRSKPQRPGLGPRVNSMPKPSLYGEGGSTFSLPVRPGPAGGLPPLPRKDRDTNPEEPRREVRRQGTWGMPSTGGYS